MTAPATTVYDEVLYPNRAFPQTHPERLATIATLFGMNPAPVTQCRVLEIGCGQGWNLFPMAYDLPESTFVGIDMAARPIALGKEAAAGLGLGNLHLLQQDILDDSADLGLFDYIIAHGIYTWTPPTVRDRLLALCRTHLAPDGVAFISYVTYPGGYLTQMTREMMQFHMQHFEGAQDRVRQARAMLKLLVDAQNEDTLYQMVLEQAYQRISTYPDEYLYHDDLEENYGPCYFHQFVDHAQQHQLQYLAEAVFFENFARTYPSHVETALQSLEDNVTLKQQYLDFLHGRKFRQSLLCHQDLTLERAISPALLGPFYMASPVRSLSEGEDSMQKFEGLRGSFAEIDTLLDQAALCYLGERWPAFVSFEELVDVVRERVGDAATSQEEARRALGETMLQLYQVNFLEVYLDYPHFSSFVSERPVVSPIARFQAQFSPYVSTLTFGSIRLGDPVVSLLVPLLDGTRTQDDLLEALLVLMDNGRLIPKQNEAPVTDREQATMLLKNSLHTALTSMAQQGLLLA